MKVLIAVLALALLTVFGAAAGPTDSDPAAAAGALKALATLKSVPFEGPYARYDGYLPETADAAFTSAYRRAFAKSVPKAIVTRDPWMLPFNGVVGPSKVIEFDGKPYVWSASCRPHDCPDAHVFVLYEPIGHTLWGAAHADSDVFVFGSPNLRQRALLLDLAASDVIAYYGDFPADATTVAMLRAALKGSRGSLTRLVLRRF